MAITILDPRKVAKFKNPLPNLLAPGFFVDGRAGGTFDISMNQGAHDFGLGINPATSLPYSTITWGYHSPGAPAWDAAGLNYLGPTIVAMQDRPVTINWKSDLPLKHLLPVDISLHWAFGKDGSNLTTIAESGVPVAVHRHGGYQNSPYDGLPDAWFTSAGLIGGLLANNSGTSDSPNYNPQANIYQNNQEAGTLWYHDHALGITRLNLYAGLAGFYILRDQFDTGIPDDPKTLEIENPLPGNYVNLDYRGDGNPDPDVYYEYPLVFQDKLFYGPGTTDDQSTPWLEAPGQLFYPSSNADLVVAGQKATLPAGVPNTSVIPEFASGNVILVNGQAWPVLDVEPRKYRFRLLNGSDSRFYNFKLPGKMQFIQIGTDVGLLNAPVQLNNLILAPGQRADVVIDFAGKQGKTLVLQNNYGGGGARPIPNDPKTTGQTMAFRVGKTITVPDVPLPASLRGEVGQQGAIALPTSVSDLDQYDVIGVKDPLTGHNVAKQLGLFESPLGPPNRFDAYGRTTPLLGTVKDGALKWEDPITEKVLQNQTEVWEVYNTTADPHPIHLHMVSFQLIDRQKFSATQVDPLTGLATPTGPLTNIKFQGRPKPAAPSEAGLLDTVIVQPGEMVRIAATFGLPGKYAWHCHILSHEDNEMMRPYEVIAAQPTDSLL